MEKKSMEYDTEKSIWLKKKRGISFEEIVEILSDQKNLLDDIKNPKKEKYKHQRMFVINVKRYIYLVPYVEDENKIFLKTIFPSRKATKQYLKIKK